MSFSERAKAERSALALLTSPKAGEMLRIAWKSRGAVHSWRLHRVHHRPGAGVTVGYTVTLQPVPKSRPALRQERYLLASTARLDEKALSAHGGVTVKLGELRVHVWEYPFDPELPALELACDSRLLGELLGREAHIELLSYRPTRRAVLRIEAVPRGSEPDIYAKVVRPAAQPDLEHRLQILEDSAAPSVPMLRNTNSEIVGAPGLVLMQAAPGVPLSRFYAHLSATAPAAGSAGAAPKLFAQSSALAMLEQLESILDALPKTAMLFPRKPAWVDRCEQYAHAAGSALPQGAERAREVARGIRALLEHADLGEVMAVHGDFYEANVYVDPSDWSVQALLDVDSLGPGYRVHDWACLLGHLAVLPDLSPDRYAHLGPLVDLWRENLSSRVDPVALCAATAGVVLSLVAGARTKRSKRADATGEAHALARLELAEQWVRLGRQALADPAANATVIELRR